MYTDMAETRRAAALCFLLLLAAFLQGNPALVSADDEVCKYRNPYVPFCKGWSCAAECWMEARIFNAHLREHRCIRGGIKGTCYCLFCGNHMRFLHLR
ncbi:hypothetical protein D1007_04796 [Hordeum vulgare]|nr:hypothetical protein D1007_04796 [Hordeum vulgare]KAI5019407.1 hypothetical protein ZWY2020_044295 [Hordeum vulgare]